MSLLTNLISYWKLDGNSNDATATANNGTDTDITYSAGNGKIVQGAGFNGTTSLIAIADDASLRPAGNFSVSAWFKSSSTAHQVLFSSKRLNSVWKGFALITSYTTTNGVLYFISDDGTNNGQVTSPGSLCDGNWHFVVATYDGTNLNLYIDNNAVVQTAYTHAPAYFSPNYVRIGDVYDGQEDRFWNGAIDEVGIWSRALSVGEVTSLWNGGAGLAYPLATDITINPPLGTIAITGYVPTTTLTYPPNLITKGNTTFSVGDILRIKDGINDEWMQVDSVTDASHYHVVRDKASSYAPNLNPAWTKGATIVNYKQSGDGGIFMTSSETHAPYLSIFDQAGSPWSTINTRLRIGNLNGYLGYTTDLYGIGIGEVGKSLTYDPTNGLRITGNIQGGTIEIGSNAWQVDSSGNMWWGSYANYAAAVAGGGTTISGSGGIGQIFPTYVQILNSANIASFGLNIALSNASNTAACIQMNNAGSSGAFGILGTFSNASIPIYITKSGTLDCIEVLNSGSGISLEIINSGNYSIPAIKITNSGMSSANPTGLYMSLASGGGTACFAFDFEGNEVVSSAVVGTQNRKIKVKILGNTYFIPAYDG